MVFKQILCLAVILLVSSQAAAAENEASIVIRHALVVGGADWYRSAGSVDPVEARIIPGEWSPPREGEAVPFPGGDRAWHGVEADSAGWIRHDDLQGGYAYAAVDSDREAVRILEGFGYQFVYVNGELRAGNLYGYKDIWSSWEPRFDFSRIPILLKKGRNDFLFLGSRVAGFKVRLVEPAADVFLNTKDVTIPDLLAGRTVNELAAVVLVNATMEWARGLRLEASVGPSGDAATAAVPDLPPLSVRKVAFRIRGDAPPPGEETAELRLRVVGGEGAVLHEATVSLAVKDAGANHRRTFLSRIDGSVQHYAVNPAQGEGSQALVLSVHGAGVEALNQSGSYEPKPWAHIVAPTNRRPFGFNWEDWGRLDALEVLDLAMGSLDVDPERVYLTGHSMGGHGAWHLGALYPDRFAAIGPSAGWISFWSYRPSGEVEPRNDVERMLMRCTLPSRTLQLAPNYALLGVYVLHGADDDNVPAMQARLMVDRLAEFHRDYRYHEEPGAGHWWDRNDEPGTDCVDWAPMFDFFAARARPGAARVRRIAFLTPSPGISADCHWLRVEAQERQLEMSRVDIRRDPGKRRFVGVTENVARLSLDVSHLAGEGDVVVEMDGDSLAAPAQGERLTLRRGADGWAAGPPETPGRKGPHRYGTFKDAFRNGVVFIYGTGGTPEESTWAYAKARFDAEHFWYQANGSIGIVPDGEFDASRDPDRNVVLYGNAATNSAWERLLRDCPVEMSRNELVLGDASTTGDDIGMLMIRPRPGSDEASVGVVGGTGITGMRLCDRRPYLSAGFSYPDLTVFRAAGVDESGDIAVLAGFFGLDWSLEDGEFAGELPR